MLRSGIAPPGLRRGSCGMNKKTATLLPQRGGGYYLHRKFSGRLTTTPAAPTRYQKPFSSWRSHPSCGQEGRSQTARFSLSLGLKSSNVAVENRAYGFGSVDFPSLLNV
jgi:hypothetical protein